MMMVQACLRKNLSKVQMEKCTVQVGSGDMRRFEGKMMGLVV